MSVEELESLIQSFSSLYIGILAATEEENDSVMFDGRFSSLYIGILAATRLSHSPPGLDVSFSSLYIGILAATFFNALF